MEKSLKFNLFVFHSVSVAMAIGNWGVHRLKYSWMAPPSRWHEPLLRLRESDPSNPPAVGITSVFDGYRSWYLGEGDGPPLGVCTVTKALSAVVLSTPLRSHGCGVPGCLMRQQWSGTPTDAVFDWNAETWRFHGRVHPGFHCHYHCACGVAGR
jgi:hypothetical protein